MIATQSLATEDKASQKLVAMCLCDIPIIRFFHAHAGDEAMLGSLKRSRQNFNKFIVTMN